MTTAAATPERLVPEPLVPEPLVPEPLVPEPLVRGPLARRLVHRAGSALEGARRRTRRRLLLAGLAVRAALSGARVTCAVAPDVRLGRRVRIRVAPGTASELRIGPGCALGDDVRVELRGGALVLGPHTDLRHRCVLEVAGRLEVAGPALVQHGCTFHCDESVTVGPYAGLGEYVSVVDSSHIHDGPSVWFVDDVRTAPVAIGAHAWLATKATVVRGVSVGERAVVGANSTVVRDVPPGALVSGVPAAVVRQRAAGDDRVRPDRVPVDRVPVDGALAVAADAASTAS